MLQNNTIDHHSAEISSELLKKALDGLQMALSTFGGPKGKAISIAIEGLEMIFDGDLDKLLNNGLIEIPELAEKLSGGLVNKKLVANIMCEVFKNETIMKAVDGAIQGLSNLIVTYIIEPTKKGIDLDSDKLKEFLDKTGPLAEPLKELVSEVDKGIDNILDNIAEKIKDAYKEVNQATDEFVKQYDEKRPSLKAALLPKIKGAIEDKANALDATGNKAAEILPKDVTYPVKIDTQHNIDPSILNQAAQLLEKSDVHLAADKSNENHSIPKAVDGLGKQHKDVHTH